MADKGRTFAAPMVRALLAGTKTQTRRLMPQQEALRTAYAPIVSGLSIFNYAGEELISRAPYNPGDRIYVREHWSPHPAFDGLPPRDLKHGSMIYTRADFVWHNAGDWVGAPFGKHRQGMHMPRWASRLTLTVNEVRVQRLNDITEEDCIAEGIEFVTETTSGRFYRNHLNPECPLMAYGAYRSLWESLHGDGSWEENPWIVAVSFDVRRGNIDAEAQNG